jgi:5-methylcytosine-specific restriction endonuclease McrA
MACLKCGSEWVTLKGKDMVSCPECCKLQRCKARKQGRLPSEQEKTCERCGCKFTASGANAMARSRHCSGCRLEVRREARRKYNKELAEAVRVPRKSNRCDKVECLACGKLLVKSQKKYCSNRCFVASRKSGDQAWDRTSNFHASTTRSVINGGVPSRRAISKLLHGFSGFARRLRRFTKRFSRPALVCRECGAMSERVLCSEQCRIAYAKDAKRRQKEAKKRYEKIVGRHFKQRAKHYGVCYVRFRKDVVYERDGYVCQLCDKPVLRTVKYRLKDGKIHMRSPTIDHIIPMSRGGNHEISNCQTACFGCNCKKGNKRIGQLRLAIS